MAEEAKTEKIPIWQKLFGSGKKETQLVVEPTPTRDIAEEEYYADKTTPSVTEQPSFSEKVFGGGKPKFVEEPQREQQIPEERYKPSKEEKLEYYKAYSKMTSAEKKEERSNRYREMLEGGMSSSEALSTLDGEELESRDILKEEQELKKRREKEIKPEITFKKEYRAEPEDEITEEPSTMEKMFGKAPKRITVKEKYLREEPEIRREIRREREPSLRDIGKGSMGSERYEPFKPDFFGTVGGFDMGVRSPMGKPTKARRTGKPPSTHIPFGGNKPPSTDIPRGSSWDRPPSTRFPSERVKAPSVRVPFRKTKPSVRVSIKDKTPSVRYKGTRKVSTKIPVKRKAPVKPMEGGKRISTRVGRPLPVKVRVRAPREDPVAILGLGDFI